MHGKLHHHEASAASQKKGKQKNICRVQGLGFQTYARQTGFWVSAKTLASSICSESVM
jgi:hypothetical protein